MRHNVEVKIPDDRVRANLLQDATEEKMNESAGLLYLFSAELKYVRHRLSQYVVYKVQTVIDHNDIEITFRKRNGEVYMRGSIEV